MTKPAPISHLSTVARFQKKGLWALFGVIILSALLDVVFGKNFFVAKGISVGAVLCHIMQSAFTFVAHRSRYHNKGGARAANQMMNDMYLAVLTKWGIAIAGFVFIFVILKDLALWAVFVGFCVMQAINAVLLYRLGKQV